MPISFCDKVPMLKYKTKCDGSSTFCEGLKHLLECYTITCIYQSMCVFIEKMVNLNKSKKGWIKFATISGWNEKLLKNQ